MLQIRILKPEYTLDIDTPDRKIWIVNIQPFPIATPNFHNWSNLPVPNKMLISGKIWMLKIRILKTEYTLYIETPDWKLPMLNIET